MLAQKKKDISLLDLKPYIDVSIYNNNELRTFIEISDAPKEKYLLVNASSKYNIDGLILVDSEFLDLTSLEDEYAYNGVCADIRYGNLDNMLLGNVTIYDYISVEIQEGFIYSDMKFWMGSLGGAVLIDSNSRDVLTLDNSGIWAKEQPIGGIEIWNKNYFGQGVRSVQTYEEVLQDDVIYKPEKMQTSEGNVWYITHVTTSNSDISYHVYFNPDYISESDFLLCTQSISIDPNVFY